jgi:hypothetical protein
VGRHDDTRCRLNVCRSEARNAYHHQLERYGGRHVWSASRSRGGRGVHVLGDDEHGRVDALLEGSH